jgi:hypothetical protein
MNPYAPYASRADIELAQDAKRQKRALECRTLRLFIATHPGLTEKEIFEGTGIRTGEHLHRMLAMKIIRVVRPTSNSTSTNHLRWYVVPQ